MIKHWELKLTRKYIYKLTISNDPNSLEFDNPQTKEGVVVKRSTVYDQCFYIIACSDIQV